MQSNESDRSIISRCLTWNTDIAYSSRVRRADRQRETERERERERECRIDRTLVNFIGEKFLGHQNIFLAITQFHADCPAGIYRVVKKANSFASASAFRDVQRGRSVNVQSKLIN